MESCTLFVFDFISYYNPVINRPICLARMKFSKVFFPEFIRRNSIFSFFDIEEEDAFIENGFPLYHYTPFMFIWENTSISLLIY